MFYWIHFAIVRHGFRVTIPTSKRGSLPGQGNLAELRHVEGLRSQFGECNLSEVPAICPTWFQGFGICEIFQPYL